MCYYMSVSKNNDSDGGTDMAATTMSEAQIKRTVRSIMQQQISYAFMLQEATSIPRQTRTVIENVGGSGATIVIRGQTNFTRGPWVTYSGYLGEWDAVIKEGSYTTVSAPYRVMRNSI
jgi:hypothetical protein